MRNICVAACVVFAGTLPAHAGPTGPGFEIVRDHVDYAVAADGSYVERQEKLFRIVSPRGLAALHEVVLSWTDGYQDASIEAAYTLKRNGSRIDVPHDKMFTGYGLTTQPGFRDQKTKIAVFENVETGDEVGYVTVFRQKKPWYPGQFFTSFALAPRVVMHDFEVSVTAPASLALHADAKGVVGGETDPGANLRRWSWTYDNASAFAPEDGSVSGTDEGAYLVVSSFADFAALAASYENGARGKARVTRDIQSLADSLTHGVSDNREKARLLYEWTAANIKYVAIVLGNGGLVPHAAEDVLASRYGDCKDHVTLLEALLAAEGIESSPALINLDPTFRQPAVASPESFNHLITYIPALDLFVDSTATNVAFGTLPSRDSDKPVLITRPAKLARTPVPELASLHTVARVTIHGDGSADAESRFTASGAMAADIRTIVARTAAEEDHATLGDAIPGAIGSMVAQSDPDGDASGYAGSAHYRIDNAANLAGPGAVSFALGYQPKSLQSLIDAGLVQRREDYVCPSFDDTDETVLAFPRGVEIAAIPKNTEIVADGVHLSAVYVRVGANEVKASLRLVAEHPHRVCTAGYYNGIRATLTRMLAVIGAQVVYRPVEPDERRASTAHN